MLREHAFDPGMERRLFSLEITSPGELSRSAFPPGHFVCLIAWDARVASVEDVSALVEPLLHAGASYVVCWGPDCERVHDIADEILSHPDNGLGIPDDACVITTWHVDVPLRQALVFFLTSAWPDVHFRASTRTAVAISIGSSEWATEIADALDHPQGFVRNMPANGA
jgi:hypothetical protein